jgi:PAS domain S-box-containing protein
VAGLAWNQYIRHEQRADYERAMQAQGYENFYIKEKSPTGKYEVATHRADYTVISFIEPVAENRILVGLNVGVDPIRSPVLERARDTGSIAMTKPLPLLQHAAFRRGVVVYYPVYTRAHNLSTAVERQRSLAGYATAIVGLDDLIPTALNAFSKKDFEVHILDITDSAEPLIFYSNLSSQVSAYAKALGVTHELSFGGRRLAVNIIPTEVFLMEKRSLQSWFVLAGGLLFCSFLGGFLLLVTGRTQHVRDLVEQRTKELAAVLEHAVESILVVDEHGKVIKANPAAMQLFGYTFDSLHTIDFGRLVPSLRALFLPDGESLKTINWRESIGIHSDGRELPIELSLSLVELQDRKFFTVIVHDATAKRKVDRLKNEFISTVSHELRTPLTSIKGALGIALGGGLGDVEVRMKDMLIIANNNVDRLARLVNDILDIDKLEFGNMQLSTRPTRVYPLLQQSMEQNQGYAARYGVRLQLENIGEDVKFLCANLDTDRFLQVMSNLLSNAIKYSHLGGVVKVTMEPGETALIISVIDEGHGIPAEFRQRIFRKFAQADSSDTRRRDGTGLGLSITKSIVEKLGGAIDYQSVEGEGSTFFFTLPIIK